MDQTTERVAQDSDEYPSVAQLDAFLNDRILAADTTQESGYWWAVKVEAKRQLEAIPPAEVGAHANRLFTFLQAQEAA